MFAVASTARSRRSYPHGLRSRCHKTQSCPSPGTGDVPNSTSDLLRWLFRLPLSRRALNRISLRETPLGVLALLLPMPTCRLLFLVPDREHRGPRASALGSRWAMVPPRGSRSLTSLMPLSCKRPSIKVARAGLSWRSDPPLYLAQRSSLTATKIGHGAASRAL